MIVIIKCKLLGKDIEKSRKIMIKATINNFTIQQVINITARVNFRKEKLQFKEVKANKMYEI